MAARGTSRAAGAAHTLRSPTAWSDPAPDPLADGRFGDFKRTPQQRDVSSFEAYYAVSPARGWLLSASAEPPKGTAPTFLRTTREPKRGTFGGSSPPRPRGCSGLRRVGLGVLFACCVRLVRSPRAFASRASRAWLPPHGLFARL